MTLELANQAPRRCLPRLVRPLTVTDFIAVLRNARPDNEHYYLNGGCWEMFRILRSLWPEAQPFHTWEDIKGHVATKIGEHLYDIRGRIRRPKLYSPMTCETWPSLRGKDHPTRWHKRYRANASTLAHEPEDGKR